MLDVDAQVLRERQSDGEYLLLAYDDWRSPRIPRTAADLPGVDAGPRPPAEATDGYNGVPCMAVHRDLGVWYGDEDGGRLDFVVMYGGLHPDEIPTPFVMAMIDSLRRVGVGAAARHARLLRDGADPPELEDHHAERAEERAGRPASYG